MRSVWWRSSLLCGSYSRANWAYRAQGQMPTLISRILINWIGSTKFTLQAADSLWGTLRCRLWTPSVSVCGVLLRGTITRFRRLRMGWYRWWTTSVCIGWIASLERFRRRRWGMLFSRRLRLRSPGIRCSKLWGKRWYWRRYAVTLRDWCLSLRLFLTSNHWWFSCKDVLYYVEEFENVRSLDVVMISLWFLQWRH